MIFETSLRGGGGGVRELLDFEDVKGLDLGWILAILGLKSEKLTVGGGGEGEVRRVKNLLLNRPFTPTCVYVYVRVRVRVRVCACAHGVLLYLERKLRDFVKREVQPK